MNVMSKLRVAVSRTHCVAPTMRFARSMLSGAEFEYRFNRRFDLPDIIARLVYVAPRRCRRRRL